MEKYKIPDLKGEQGNAYYIMGYVADALAAEKRNDDEIKLFKKRAMEGDYYHLVGVSLETLQNLNRDISNECK